MLVPILALGFAALPDARGDGGAPGPPPITPPEPLRADLAIDLFAREPDIATPIALDVDGRGRVWAIESNTHFQDPGYARHPTDRILVIADIDQDGAADRFVTFADGLHHGMGLALEREGPALLSPAGEEGRAVLLATRRDVRRLEDQDGDGRADHASFLARLETAEQYPHNGLSGFAFDDLGHVYFAIGENMGVPYRLRGADGIELTGGPDGGSIFRMHADGSCLERWARGFWNTFHMHHDAFGRLFAVDNDPDSRPPCRLLHIVRGGDYGYRRWLGRKGLHPFTSWNGELPGTLPMVAGTGEAPSGILAYEHAGLPADLAGALLVTSWGDHRIEAHRPEPRGASFRSRPEPIVGGGEMFRPVGIAAAPSGDLFIADWVDKEYHVHGKGRIWRLRPKERAAAAGLCPRAIAASIAGAADAPAGGPGGESNAERVLSHPLRAAREAGTRALATLAGGDWIAREVLRRAPDPRARYHALQALARRDPGKDGAGLGLRDPDPRLRAAALRLLAEHGAAPLDAILSGLDDPMPEVKLEALLALARAPEAARAIAGRALAAGAGAADPFLLGAAVEALARAGPGVLAERQPEADPARRLVLLLASRRSGMALGAPAAAEALRDPDAVVRRAAIQWIGEERLLEHRGELEGALGSGPISKAVFDAFLAAKALLDGESPESRDTIALDDFLLDLCRDRRRSQELRAHALRALDPRHPRLGAADFQAFLAEKSPELRVEAVRSLRESTVQEAAGMLAAAARDRRLEEPVRREAVAGLSRFLPAARRDLEEIASSGEKGLAAEAERALRWAAGPAAGRNGAGAAARRAELLAGGDPRQGELLFFHPQGPRCSACHGARGRGGLAGPDLSAAGHMPRARLVDSVLEPGKEVAPQFATWVIDTDSGVRTGVLLGEREDGSLRIADATGTVELLPAAAVRSRTLAGTSLMPDDIATRVTVEEIRDILAFLESLR